jgi:hypothetical protein
VKDPHEEAQIEVERLRQSLSIEFLQHEAHPEAIGLTTGQLEDQDGEATFVFDDLDETPAHPPEPEAESGPGPALDADLDAQPTDNAVSAENSPIILPSTHMRDNKTLCEAELTLRIQQATRFLAAIRDAVADKSFQYSHILRSASSKGVRTRSRTLIAKTNNRISYYCRVYVRSRAAMVKLGAAPHILDIFQVLQKEDVKASTAILDPNIPGSTNLRLSWIWHTNRPGSGSGSGLDTMRECMSSIPFMLIYVLTLSGQSNVSIGLVRVHKRIDGRKNLPL